MQVNQDDRITKTDSKGSSNRLALVIIVLLLAVAAGLYFYFTKPSPAPVMPPKVEAPAPEPQAQPEPEPVPTTALAEVSQPEAQPEVIQETEQPAPEPLPALADSDPLVQQHALLLTGNQPLQPLLAQSDLARQFVVFVDNLAQGELARKTSPLKGPSQAFSVSEITDKIYMNPDSFHRYDSYANLLDNLDRAQLQASLKMLAPLFDQAFSELGYSDMNFESRLQQAFKQVLAAPIIEEPIELTSISVNYRFADPKLEALPAVQKLMLRMGPENSRKIKAAIRRLQADMKP